MRIYFNYNKLNYILRDYLYIGKRSDLKRRRINNKKLLKRKRELRSYLYKAIKISLNNKNINNKKKKLLLKIVK